MDTLIVDDEPLARDELGYLLNQCTEVNSLYEAESIEEALGYLIEQTIDLIFLDIHLTEESGITLAEKLQQLDNPPMIVFATAYDEHAVQAFELNAIDYILKPFSFDRIQQAVQRAHRQHASRRKVILQEVPVLLNDSLPLQTDDRIVLVKIETIIVVSVNQGEMIIYTDKEEFTIQGTLNGWEEKLADYKSFIRVHRSFLINLQKMKEIQPWFNHTYQLTMENNLKVPVSRFYIPVFREAVGL